MTKLITNKGASHYAVLSLGIAMFLLMFFFTAIFVNLKQDSNNGKSIILFELKDGHPSNIKELLLDELNLITKLNAFNSQYLSKEEALLTFKDKLDSESYKALKSNNPLNSIVRFETTLISNSTEEKVNVLKNKLDNYVTNVKIRSTNRLSTLKFDYVLKAFIPFIFICLIFCVNILMGSVRGDLLLNKTDIKKAIIAGVDSKVLHANLKSNMFKSFCIASIIAITLYILTFYLITSFIEVKFSDFSFYIFLKPIFTALFVVLICLLLIINFKVKNFLKTI